MTLSAVLKASKIMLSPSRCLRLVWLTLLCAAMLCVGSMQARAAADKASIFYEDALKRFEKEDFSGAVVQLKNAIKEDQRMLAAHLLLGKALAKSGDLKGAEAAFEEAIKQGVDRGEIALPLGRLYLALGESKMVIDRIPATNLKPVLRAQVLSMRGTAYAELGNSRMAAQSFEEARAADPTSAEPMIAEGPLLLSAGQRDQAAAMAAKAVELAPDNGYAWNLRASIKHAGMDFKGALADYDRAIQLEPKLADARVARAGILIDLKRDAEALRDLDFLDANRAKEPRGSYLRAMIAARKGDAAEVSKILKDVAALVDSLPQAWLAKREQYLMVGALAHYTIGSMEKAREYLDIIVGRNAQNLAARKLLASIHIDRRDYTKASPHIEILLRALPDDSQVLFLAGSYWLGQRRYAQAADLLERAVSRAGRSDMNRNLAFSQIGLGRDQLGIASLEKALAANPGDALSGTTLAMLYAQQGQPQKAIKTAELMVKRDPNNLTALNFLGTVLAGTGDVGAARAIFSQVLAKAPTFFAATLNLVKLDVSEGKYDDGRRRLNAILAKQNANFDALYELGMLEKQANRLPEAMRHLKKADETQRKDTRAGLALLDVQLAQRQGDEAVATAKDLYARFPDDLVVQLALARAFTAAGDAASAKNLLQNATRLAEYDPDRQVTIGRMQLAAGNPDGAIYNVQKALQGRPDDLPAMMLAAEVEIRRKDFAKADLAVKALTAKHAKRVETAVATAMLASARGQHGAAVVAYRNALGMEETVDNVLNLASSYMLAGEAPKATSLLEGWLRKHPNDRAVLKNLAQAQFRAGALEPARLSYTKALALEPENSVLLNDFANLLLRLKDPAALAAAEKALKLAPGNPAIADTLGWILVQNGQVDAGLRHLREARLRSPDNSEIRFHLAFALAKTGRNAEARDELRVALANMGSTQERDEMLRLKKELGL